MKQRKIRHLSLVFLVFVITGCTTDFWVDAAKPNHNDVYDAMFTDIIRGNINSELKLEKPPEDGTWQNFWIDRCEQVYYATNMGDSYVQYIIEQRRAAGLPEIPEIDKRQFRSELQIFTDQVDKQLNRESQGASPPAIAYDKIWVKTWPEYWTFTDTMALRNSAVSTNGVNHIIEGRKQLGLPPLN